MAFTFVAVLLRWRSRTDAGVGTARPAQQLTALFYAENQHFTLFNFILISL
jgi:hypothetical protein